MDAENKTIVGSGRVFEVVERYHFDFINNVRIVQMVLMSLKNRDNIFKKKIKIHISINNTTKNFLHIDKNYSKMRKMCRFSSAICFLVLPCL